MVAWRKWVGDFFPFSCCGCVCWRCLSHRRGSIDLNQGPRKSRWLENTITRRVCGLGQSCRRNDNFFLIIFIIIILAIIILNYFIIIIIIITAAVRFLAGILLMLITRARERIREIEEEPSGLEQTTMPSIHCPRPRGRGGSIASHNNRNEIIHIFWWLVIPIFVVVVVMMMTIVVVVVSLCHFFCGCLFVW